MQLSEEYVIMAPAKDEENYICEWIKYHLDLGFDKIYLYDNNDDSNILPKVLYYNLDKSYIDRVIIYPIPGLKAFKRQICLDFLNEKEFKWCAVIDCDEFITLTSHKNIKDYINSFPSDCEQILLPWLFYDPGDFKGDIPIPLLERGYFPYTPLEKIKFNHAYGKSIQKKTNKEKKGTIFHWNFNENIISYFQEYEKINFVMSLLLPPCIKSKKFIPKFNNFNNAYIKHFFVRSHEDNKKKEKRGRATTTNIKYNKERIELRKNYYNLHYLEPDQFKLSKYEFPNGILKDEFEKLKGKKILITKENLLPYVLKEGFNITYSGDLTNLNKWINISAYNKCNFNWVDKKFFDNVYKESDFDFVY